MLEDFSGSARKNVDRTTCVIMGKFLEQGN